MVTIWPKAPSGKIFYKDDICRIEGDRFFLAVMDGDERWLKALRAKAAEVPGVRPTLPDLLAKGEDQALVGVPLDFRADALWLESDPSFGARPAPLSHVG
ncbi:hypothetical protein KSX_66760 [Ktedonospora formicarum]|uniref:Uncharacterized protein n=1 Tax=Ktedonospora formicarum TaxID=2778364 RepID=A0A8J3IA36_9CHLR|nr:hypothetical protein KSX_66760 [Ktedonospora formicarum]